MPSVNNMERAIEFANKAVAEDEKENYVEAYGYYTLSMEYLKNCEDGNLEDEHVEMLTDYHSRAEEFKGILRSAVDKTKTASESGGRGTSESIKTGKAGSADAENKKLEDSLASSILTDNPNVRWVDVAGLDTAKALLHEAVIWPTSRPDLFKHRTPWKGILLYGPPGTGKSYLAKAVATEAGGKFFAVSSSDLVSKWQGDSEKLVRTLFEMARKNESKPSIIFIDEIDSIITTRTETESDGSRRIKTELLVQMDGIGYDNTGVFVLCATNVPWQLDSAIKRRLEKRIYIPLPGREAIRDLFRIHLGTTPHTLTDKDFDLLAEQTSGFSGSDISTAVRDAKMQPVRKIFEAKRFEEVTDKDTEGQTRTRWKPSFDHHTGKEMALSEIDINALIEPPVVLADFLQALRSVRSTVTQSDLTKYDEWTNESGVSGVTCMDDSPHKPEYKFSYFLPIYFVPFCIVLAVISFTALFKQETWKSIAQGL